MICKKIFKKNEKLFCNENFLRNLRMCELLANGIGIRSFLYDVYALQYLRNMEEQAKSFWLTMIVHQQEAMTQNNTTQLHLSWNRKLRETVTYLRIVTIFVS